MKMQNLTNWRTTFSKFKLCTAWNAEKLVIFNKCTRLVRSALKMWCVEETHLDLNTLNLEKSISNLIWDLKLSKNLTTQ